MKTTFIILLFLLSAFILSAFIINIPDDYTTIQEGIDASVDGDTVLVQPGTYIENINYNGKNITVASLFLTTQDTTYISQTVIDGDSLDSVIKFENGEDSSALLTGFTITNGHNTFGGGIFIINSNPVVENVTISGNSSSSGGGIYCEASNPTLQDVTISNNENNNFGGGIFCVNSSPILQNVTITGNSTYFYGGGIYCANSNPTLENVTISDNSAYGYGGNYGGGIYCESSSPTLQDVTISGNSAGVGGGIYCYNSSPFVENVTISGNSAEFDGGGIYCSFNSNPILQDVIISDNSADCGGGIYCNNDSNPTLQNVTITGNTAVELGGGIYCNNDSNPDLENVTITGNTAVEHGGGIYCGYSSSPSFSADNRCNVYSNTIENTRGYGSDIFAEECDIVDVIVDTFTVMFPTDYYASPIDNFTFDILQCVVDSLINADVYVSVDGDNSNSGISSDLPFKTIKHALSRIYFDSLNINTIHLAPGVYSNSTNGEILPIPWSSYVNLSGNSENETILDAENTSRVLNFYSVTDALINNITITNGNGGIYLSNSSPNLENVTINNNSGYGIYCSNSNPILINVTISGNSTYGIYCSNSSPSLVDVTISGNSSSSGSGIYCGGSNPIFENVTISGNYGSGISCDNSNPILQNVIISDNSADFGGGIYCIFSNPILQNVTISDNSASYCGGGIYCGGYQNNGSNPTLQNVTITGNTAVEHGGGIYCYDNSNPDLENVIIIDNSANYGGGIYCYYNSNPILQNVTITGNTAVELGGGIYCRHSSSPSFSADNRCSIYSNTIENTRGFGSDIFAEEWDVIDVIVDTFTVMTPTDYYASPIDDFTFDILHCVVDSLINADVYVSVDGDNSNSGISPDLPFKTINYALERIYTGSMNINTIHLAPGVYSNSSNGEIFPIPWSSYVNLTGNSENETILDAESTSRVLNFYSVTDATISNITITNGNSGNGIYCNNSDPILQDVTIIDNAGSGIHCYYSNPILQNVTINNNSGEGIHCSHSSPSLINVTISGNSADGYGGGIYCFISYPTLTNSILWNNSPQEIYIDYGSVSATYSDIQGGWEGEGNIDEDPLFVNPAVGDYHLTENSPCIDSGDPFFPPDPDDTRADMGASYFHHMDGEEEVFANFYAETTIAYILLPVNFYDLSVAFNTEITTWLWDFDNDGTIDSYEQDPSYIYQNIGIYSISLTVEDDIGNSNTIIKNDHITVQLPDYSDHCFHISPEGSDGLNGNGSPEYPYATIQHGISIAENGDTVMVHQGIYPENINYNGKNIIVGSLFLTTQDTTYISQTIIDGTQNGSVVTFESGEDSTAVLSGFSITNGAAFSGGGIFCNTSNPSIQNVAISGNSADIVGGGISLSNSNSILQDVTISNNEADNSGGGIYCANSNPTLFNITIKDNSSFFGGGISCTSSSPSLVNVLISGNTADSGGGIRCIYNSNLSLVNVTLVHNSAADAGGGINCGIISNPTLVNCILWNDSPEEIYIDSGSVSATYSDIAGGWEGEGNIDAEPLFAGIGDHPFMLQDLSPCVNAGIPDTTGLNLPEFDLAGNPRVYGGRIDMGAYENQNVVVNAGEDMIPLVTKLYQNYPNPFNPETVISFQLSGVRGQEDVELVIYNIKGQKIKTLTNSLTRQPTNSYEVTWDGRDDHNQPVSSGIYLYKLQAGKEVITRKMILLK